MRHIDPVAQAEIDRLTAKLAVLEAGEPLVSEALRDEIRRLTAGADPTPREECSWPTAGQLWHELLQWDEEKRLAFLQRTIDDAEELHRQVLAKIRGLREDQ